MKSRLGDNRLEALDQQTGTASREIASHYARSGEAGGLHAGLTGGHEECQTRIMPAGEGGV